MADKSSSASTQLAKLAVGGDGNALAEAASVDKIRDLLFGNQMQDYDQRFAKLETRLLERLKDIESEAARNLAGIMHHKAGFARLFERARAGDPTGWVGVR